MVRITQSMQIARTLLDQNLNLQRMNEYSNDMSSRLNLHRPSDDPIRVARAMRLQTELRVNETYKANLQASESWTSKTDVTLTTLADIIKRVRELTVQAASEDKTTEDKQRIRSEIEQLKKSAIQIANDDYMGRYQFSGYKTDKKFVNEDGKYNTELNLAGLKYEKINYNIGVGQKTDINFSGVEVFGNEYFGTKSRATDGIPFTDEPESVLGAKVNIKLKKYKPLEKYYTKNKNNLDTQAGAANEDKKKNELDEKYEKLRKLTDTIGNEIDLSDISFYGSYKKGDVNAIVEDLNKSLREKIDAHVKSQPLTTEQKKALKEELYQAVQFVNDDGKVSLVTDRNYSGKIEAKKLSLSEINANVTSTKPTVQNLNHEINLTNTVDFSTDPVRTYFNFNLKLSEYKRDDDGNVDPLNKSRDIDIKNITLTKEYEKNGQTDEELAKTIAADLQNKIKDELIKRNIDPDTVKVVVEGGQPRLIVNREYGAKVTNIVPGTNLQELESTIATQTYTPNENPRINKLYESLDSGVTIPSPTSGKDILANLNFNLKLTQFSRYGGVGGDVLTSQPNETPGDTGIPDGKSGFLVNPPQNPKYPAKEFNLNAISVTKTYSGKNPNGSIKSSDELLKEIATDLQIKINEKCANLGIDANKVRVEVKEGKINLLVDGNLKAELTNTNPTLPQNTFDESQKNPQKDTKSDVNIALPPVTSGKDTHVYMNLNMGVEKYALDEKGNTKDTKLVPKIDISDITINKTYKALKDDGTPYTENEIKQQIFNDIKAKIEEKLGQLNPQLDKKAVNIELDGNNVKIKVNQDIELSVKSNDEKPSSLISNTTYMPEQANYQDPQREMMPFFEMMDRIMKFMDEGNSKGLSRMLDVIDYHAKNNQKNQGIGGGRSNMYKIMLERTEDVKLNYSQLRSETIETDYNETSMKMMVAQYVYRASLAVTAKIIQPSLVDFLR